MSAELKLRERIVAIGHSLYTRGLSPGSSGNISARLEDGWLLTPTNSCLGELDPALLSKLDWNGNLVSGAKPSKEYFLHLAMYQKRQQSGAIVHLHSSHAAAISCLDGLDPAGCLPPITPYFVMRVGQLPLIPYFRPGDKALALEIAKHADKHAAVLLANHGPVVSGQDLDSAMYAMEELEETAKLILLLLGQKIRTLNKVQIQELCETFGARWES
ncbi:MAG: 3-dehydro-4-phosphotetronate decarboxylase [Verrucomicrobiota bacterium]|jgi:ribulose-5-phosphate 4-epimerase/fuculose-1-phosphate aldolase|nr:3-dehydro-4-phosphotetronate decarboxylase [Verrucomicrobiota bacterium]MEA3204632.1 3-dehydro-4-phosphotetronate decarboxylase [Verrucomicrobiota bacterium]